MREEYLLLADGQNGGETLLGNAAYAPRPGAIRIWRSGQKRADQIALPFFPHAFAAHPEIPQRVVTFEKWGRHLAEVDLLELRTIRVTESAPKRRFFGHGAHDGKHIYVSQMDDTHHRGLVAVLDAETHKLVGEIETGGAFPHECRWLPDRKTLLVLNSRSRGLAEQSEENPSVLSWVNTATGKCTEQRAIRGAPSGFAHFVRSQDGLIMLAGVYDGRDGAQPLLGVLQKDGSLKMLDVAAGGRPLRGEVLNLHLYEDHNTLIATLPSASLIQKWNYLTGKLQGQIQLAEPRGLAWSQELGSLLVSAAGTQELNVLGESLENVRPVLGGAGRGSHLFHHEL